MSWIVNTYNKFYIKALLVFNPAMLFTKINQLDWYKQLLHNWVIDCIDNNEKVLEVGCSTGLLTQYLSDLGLKPIGVDLSKNSIDQAQSNYPNISFQVENAIDLSFKDKTFDAVIAASLVNIVDDKQKAIDEIIRVCEVGGRCSILVPNTDFNQTQFTLLLEDLNLSGFSLEALKAWNRQAPKMDSDIVLSYFPTEYLDDVIERRYLNGMISSFTVKKNQHSFQYIL